MLQQDHSMPGRRLDCHS